MVGPVWCAGTLAPGDGVGTLTLGGGLDLSAGGIYKWELSALTPEGPGVNFDQIVLTDGNLALGGASRLYPSFTGTATAPSESEPCWLRSHSWKVVALTGTATNTGATCFAVVLNSHYPVGSFTNYADADGGIILAWQAVPGAPPVIQSVTPSGTGQYVLTFAAETNRTYVLQCATNLTSPVWINLSTNVATSSSLTLTNDAAGDPARFYRVFLMP